MLPITGRPEAKRQFGMPRGWDTAFWRAGWAGLGWTGGGVGMALWKWKGVMFRLVLCCLCAWWVSKGQAARVGLWNVAWRGPRTVLLRLQEAISDSEISLRMDWSGSWSCWSGCCTWRHGSGLTRCGHAVFGHHGRISHAWPLSTGGLPP